MDNWMMNEKPWTIGGWMKQMYEWELCLDEKCELMKWKIVKTCRWKLHEWLIKGRWMKTLDKQQQISHDEQLTNLFEMEFIVLFQGGYYR
jgi:hypothetical protein